MTAVPFEKASASPIRFDKKLGLCFGWFCFSKKNGVEYDDLHGDHMPDDELIPAVDTLMAKAASERLIDVEHVGGGRGSIATAVALTEDVAKASSIDTGGTYGVWGSFRPDAALLKSIEAGEAFCLSVAGAAHDVEVLAKSADGAELVKGRKRILRKIELTRLAVVKAGAHEGAGVDLIKSAPAPAVVAPLAKRTPALTSLEAGHQHSIYDTDDVDGCTSWDNAAGEQWSHSHRYIRNADGSLTIGAANGHRHTLATDSTTGDSTMADADLAKTLATAQARAATVLALPVEQFTFAKGLSGDRLESFLAATPADRAAQSTPVYKAADGTCYFAGDDQRMVNLAKSDDAKTVELAKAKDAAEAVTFEKAATLTIPHLKGTLPQKAAIMKSIAGLPDADRAAVLEILKGADAAMKMLSTPVGFAGTGDPIVKSAQDELDALAADIRKTQNVSIAKAIDLALSTPRGAQLYDAIEAAKRPTARA